MGTTKDFSVATDKEYINICLTNNLPEVEGSFVPEKKFATLVILSKLQI